MSRLCFYIDIAATQARVWQVLTDLECYQKWASAFSPYSTFEGQWASGESIKFVVPEMGGTHVWVAVFEPYERIELHHFDVISPEPDQALLTTIDQDIIKKWIGTREYYQLSVGINGVRLTVEIEVDHDFVAMCDHSWPQALKTIKILSESHCERPLH